MNSLGKRSRCLWLYTITGLMTATGCFEDPATSLTNNSGEEESGDGDGDGDTGDGDGDTGDGDGDGDTGDGDGDGDGEPGDGDGDGEPGDGDGDGDGDEECGPAETLCPDGCVNLSTNWENCGQCGMTCQGFELCGDGMCKPERYVFATNALYPGNFGGVQQADIACQATAVQASLPGTYRAWVSSLMQSPMNWMVGDGIWRLRGDADTVVAYSRIQLFSGNLASPINRDEYGQPLVSAWACNNTVEFPVWTATSDAGTADGPDCGGWLSNLGQDSGGVGNAAVADKEWSLSCTLGCSAMARLYCFQQ